MVKYSLLKYLPALFLSLFVIALFILFIKNIFTLDNAGTKIVWQHYSTNLFDQSRKNNRLILLFGHSQTCHWCREMEKSTWTDPDLIQTVQAHYIPVIVDVDTETSLVLRYTMTSLPTTIILDSQNHILKIFAGYLPPDEINNYLKALLQTEGAANT